MTSSTNGGGLHRDRPLLGLIVKMPAAATVELAGHAGFDYVLIDTEHGPSGMTELEHHIRAADSAGIRSLVRVSDARSPDILRALDTGAHGIVVPHIRSADDVAAAAALVRYPPAGRRSLALSTRAGRHGLRPLADHLDAARRDVVLIGQLEDAEALERMPEILGTDGLDGVFIGPSDLSASLGRPGETTHPAVVDALDRIRQAVIGTGLSLCMLAADEREAQRLVDSGANLVFLNAPSLLAGRLSAVVTALALDHEQGARRWPTTT
ncbi:MAG TPA: aldolase/citrate lyase family protein [Baekduia sp.]|uniref:HpcH/HpaI aldolase family protein n=1 Tax=Baekduia sp. TaxID=2600305 RepID=UPI002D79C447|nr:aldolase/citrate lyase family protein [Baekduia sp.]HET6507831.1 aldolase/citrate lyase family protein [Baekduia sp.]